MKTIKVTEVIESPSALTRQQGEIVYNLIVDELDKNNEVALDFHGVESIITPFLNVSIGKLYERYSSNQLKELLHLEHLPSGTVSKFNLVISNAKMFYNNAKEFERVVEKVMGSNGEE